MKRNSNLTKAKKAKNDEFYTQTVDSESLERLSMDQMDHGILQNQFSTEKKNLQDLQSGSFLFRITFAVLFKIIGLVAGNIKGLAGIPTSGKNGPYLNHKLKYGRIFVQPR